jgi:serine/threonine-protein kinase RsbW
MAGRVWRFLPARAEAVPLARQLVGELDVDSATARVLALLTSEVVTNAVVHGPTGDDDQISLDARLTDDHVFVQVCDEGSDTEPAIGRRPDPLEAGGHGLRVVERLAAAWGTRLDEIRCVWFRLPQSSA